MRDKIYMLLFAVMFFVGCVTAKKTRAIMDSWIGHHKSELIQSWGPPNRYESDGKDGEILIYESTITRGVPIGNTYYVNTTHPAAMFYADRNGKLYYWRTSG